MLDTCTFSATAGKKIISGQGCSLKNGRICVAMATCKDSKGVELDRMVTCSEENCKDGSTAKCIRERFIIEDFVSDTKKEEKTSDTKKGKKTSATSIKK